MNLKQAIQKLDLHNQWRRDNEGLFDSMPVNPTDLGKAIDVILNHFNNFPIEKIKDWAVKRNLHNQDPRIQLAKLMEESGELAQAILKGRNAAQIDTIGDIVVVLIVISQQLGLHFESCVLTAYNEIKDRKGKMINGTFVKEDDY